MTYCHFVELPNSNLLRFSVSNVYFVFVLKVTSLFASTSQYLRRNTRREGGEGAWRPAQSAVTVGTVCEIFGLYCWHHCCSQMLGWWWCSQAWWREKTCRVSRRVGTVAHSAQLAFSNISSVFRSLCDAHRPLLAGTQRLLCHLTIHFCQTDLFRFLDSESVLLRLWPVCCNWLIWQRKFDKHQHCICGIS